MHVCSSLLNMNKIDCMSLVLSDSLYTQRLFQSLLNVYSIIYNGEYLPISKTYGTRSMTYMFSSNNMIHKTGKKKINQVKAGSHREDYEGLEA